MTFRSLTALAAVFSLVACGGGGGGSSATTGTTGGGPSGPNPGPELAQIRTLTGAAPPAETAGDQGARAPGIVSRADSLLVSTIRGETGSRDLPTFALRASCSGTSCTVTEPTTGYSDTIRLSDLEFVPGNDQPVGTKRGITLIRSTGRHDGTDFRTLGAWIQHSGFAVQTERGTIDGVRVDGRYGMAGGDLTGSRPLGSATWHGLMVGTPGTGAGRGDRLQGDATLTYSLDTQMLGAAFTNIQNIDRLRAHSVSTVRFTGVPIDSRGQFQAGVTGNRIQGGLYGSGHAEATGIFEQSNIVGAFGAKRQ